VTSDGGVYGYLVNEHWSPDAQYTLISFRDPQLAIPWPLPIDESLISDKDLSHPPLDA
jgi:dTDP-4-dehydrorhamnose 3,5-epimerase